MKVVVVLAHPKRDGFNRAIAQQVLDFFKRDPKNLVDFLDLYAEHFDPVLSEDEIPRKFSFDETTLRYQQLIKDAHRVVFIHPDWWGGPPAILKGYLDRVFRPGVAYGFREADFRNADSPGLFSNKRFDVFITTDAQDPDSSSVQNHAPGIDEPSRQRSSSWPPARVWKEQVLEFCGVKAAYIHVFWNLRGSTYAERKAYLDSIPTRML
ncbi:NAD(P)H-dependent oxidoreductase [Gracilinema caldarium]|uniref:NAD(P)H dehydrogenase (Quinone) n=1 Tax=Gracilinema caldarium (strain ATCC 51460 / DSM 7334 / H1) TaxID=744872 RepID=F8EZX8_GRAC1|nr:NAD(P)H-dependent oxidoreductase [Gracilinema caldarium]AEJ18491.1 NAD(P)H dehydrogenase (quinone) [Gracilinema caldarium DSM 7334]